MTMNSRMDADYVVLKQYGCSYLGPSYDPRTHRGPTPYCGSHDLADGKLYCTEHYSLMFQKGTALRKRKKDTRRADALRQLVSDFNAAVEELESEGFDCYGSEVVEELN